MTFDPDYMCPNCVTPWKCNGPHITPDDDSLDAAWADAEAALPDGPWMLEVIRRGVINGDENPYTGYVIDRIPERYEASAGNTWSGDDGPRAFGATPAAALRALAKLLAGERS